MSPAKNHYLIKLCKILSEVLQCVKCIGNKVKKKAKTQNLGGLAIML